MTFPLWDLYVHDRPGDPQRISLVAKFAAEGAPHGYRRFHVGLEFAASAARKDLTIPGRIARLLLDRTAQTPEQAIAAGAQEFRGRDLLTFHLMP